MRRLFAIALLLVAGCGGSGRETFPAPPEQLVLHLRDLPRGYASGDDSGCGEAAGLEGDWPKLAPLFASETPSACVMEINWVWEGKPPYSRSITSSAYVFKDEGGARKAFEARDELASLAASLEARTHVGAALGDEGELLRGRGLNNPASGVVWRNRNVVALVAVEPADDAAARTLARKQQQRIEHPSPSLPETEDPALQLDDPTLKLPVYWLGRKFDPPSDLPPLELNSATVGGNGPGQSVQLWYGIVGVSGTVTFDTYEPEVWRRFRSTRLGRLVWDSPCAEKTVVPVRGGRAEIYRGYGNPYPVRRPCPSSPPSRVIAHVYYPKVVVVVNLPYCYACALHEPSTPYNSVEATKILVLALRLR
jgi:hypothetical protein